VEEIGLWYYLYCGQALLMDVAVEILIGGGDIGAGFALQSDDDHDGLTK